MTDNEKKKEYLKSYEKDCRKLESLEDQLQATLEAKTSAKSQTITDMPKANNQSDLSDYIVRVDELIEKIRDSKKTKLQKRIDIESKIVDMEDGVESDILRRRYLEFEKWESICMSIDYSWKQTHRLHAKALHSFKMT